MLVLQYMSQSWHDPDASSPLHGEEIDQWVRQAQQGDVEAFNALINRFARDVYGRVFYILKNHDDADDVVQDTFLRLYQSLSTFKFQSSFRTWLITVATRQALNFIQRKRKNNLSIDATVAEHGDVSFLQDSATQLDFALSEEQRSLLYKEITRLPVRQKEALLMRLEEDLPYEEIAQRMGTSVGTAKSHIFHAIKFLTNSLRPHHDE